MVARTTICGIYCLVFPSGHYYFGQSVDIWHRGAVHLTHLKNQYHSNRWMRSVQQKYGFPVLRVMCICAEDDLDRAEQMYLDEHWGLPFCLNLARYAESPGRGRKATAEEREEKRRQGKESWANGTNALRNCIGMNTDNVLEPRVRAKALAARRTPENRAMQAELRARLHQEPEFKEAHRAGVARHRANEEQQQNRLDALRTKHQDREFTERRLALCKAACQKAVECVETGQTWQSAAEWKRWVKEEYGVVVNLSHVSNQRPYKGFTYRYIA